MWGLGKDAVCSVRLWLFVKPMTAQTASGIYGLPNETTALYIKNNKYPIV